MPKIYCHVHKVPMIYDHGLHMSVCPNRGNGCTAYYWSNVVKDEVETLAKLFPELIMNDRVHLSWQFM